MSGVDTALVFDVQRFSIHDGPGLRTVVFFKGCGMSCAWCQNPEAIDPAPELAYYADRCLDGCTACVPACPEGALTDARTDRVDFARCTACGDCVDPCPADALRIVGRTMTADALLAEVLKDRSFFEASGGGLTLSGGEPVLHAPFLETFLPMARAEGLSVVLETAGFYKFALLEPLLPWVDLILYDVKLADPDLHCEYTHRDADLVLENLERLVARGAPVQVRMPVVPGYTTRPANVNAMRAYLRRIGVRALTLVRYNHLWEAKLPRLHSPQRPLGVAPPDEAVYADLAARFAEADIVAAV